MWRLRPVVCRSASCITPLARSRFGEPRISPRWNEGGYGAGQYDAGIIVYDVPNPTITPSGPAPATTARGIQTFWDTSTLPTLTSDSKLWYGEAPNQPVTPYAVLILVSEPETDRTTAFAVFEATYQINCMHDRLADAEAMADQVWDAFNRAQLVRNGEPVMFCLSGRQHSMLGVQLGTDGKDCWISYVEIQILYSR